MLSERSPNEDDRTFLETAIDMLNPLKTNIERLLASKNILKRKPGYYLYWQLFVIVVAALFILHVICILTDVAAVVVVFCMLGFDGDTVW